MFSIDGNIGSGKSTLYASLQQLYKDRPSVIFVPEPVSQWEKIRDKSGKTMLHLFYTDQEKYAFAFQMMAYISRLSILRRIIAENKFKCRNIVIITERTLYTDKYIFAKMLFDQGKIEDVEYQIYLTWFDEFSIDFPLDNVVYVKTSPEKCYERIHKRSREGEEIIPLAYLEDCHRYHEEFLDKDTGIKVNQLIIDGNMELKEGETATMDGWLHQIDSFIGLDELI
jgi:deoxyadenosine/deoxycytidine kinase